MVAAYYTMQPLHQEVLLEMRSRHVEWLDYSCGSRPTDAAPKVTLTLGQQALLGDSAEARSQRKASAISTTTR